MCPGHVKPMCEGYRRCWQATPTMIEHSVEAIDDSGRPRPMLVDRCVHATNDRRNRRSKLIDQCVQTKAMRENHI